MTEHTKSPAPQKRPGTRLMKWGMVLLVLGIVFCVLALSATHIELDPVTMRNERVRGTPTPLAWITLTAGAVLVVTGYGKRMLAAVESRA